MISLLRWPKVMSLREKLNGKAKTAPEYCFYTLYDKVCREDFLEAAYAQVRSNGGAAGVDRMTIRKIESYGPRRYLAELAEELKARKYRPQPVRRVLIPKAGQPGKYRPLGIPTIRDRIVQQAVKLLLEPIFEADFPAWMFGYRAGKSAQDAVAAVSAGLRSGFVDVVDADLSKYFDTIPHAELMRSVERRVADRRILWLVRHWLKAPVHEREEETGKTRVTGGQSTKQGTPQGGVISPLLANIYFRRFIKAWEKFGLYRKYRSRIVNYADDFVILTRGCAPTALDAARRILTRMGLTLNETKTRTCQAWEESFNFLGYAFKRMYTWGGQAYLGKRPAEKNVARYRETIRQLTDRDQRWKEAEVVAKALNRVTRGFWNYFRQGTRSQVFHNLNGYLLERMSIWAKNKYTRSRRKRHRAASRRTRRERIWSAVGLVELARYKPRSRKYLADACFAQ